MKELVVAVGLLVLLAGWGIFQTQYRSWKVGEECGQLLLYLDTGREDKAWWYLTSQASVLKADTPDDARKICEIEY